MTTSGEVSPSWLDTHWKTLAAAFFGLTVGAALGWWLGSWTSCGDSCEPSVATIEAIGTWVGGLGTVGAVGFAVLAFRTEQRERRAAEQKRREEEHAEREKAAETLRLQTARSEQERAGILARDTTAAALVTIECRYGSHDGHHFTSIQFIKFNGVSESPAYNVDAIHDRFGPLGSRTHTLAAGEKETFTVPGQLLTATPIEVPNDFTAWQLEQANQVTLTFTLRGRRWQRRGSGLVEYVKDVE